MYVKNFSNKLKFNNIGESGGAYLINKWKIICNIQYLDLVTVQFFHRLNQVEPSVLTPENVLKLVCDAKQLIFEINWWVGRGSNPQQMA